MPTLDELQAMIRRLGKEMNSRIEQLTKRDEPSITESEISNHTLKDQQVLLETTLDLRKCLQSAASVVSSASTVMDHRAGVESSTDYGSDFGDVFPPVSDDSMIHWIESNSIHELRYF